MRARGVPTSGGDKDDPHLNVWRQYRRRVGKSNRIWHETYLIQAGQYEAVYGSGGPS